MKFKKGDIILVDNCYKYAKILGYKKYYGEIYYLVKMIKCKEPNCPYHVTCQVDKDDAEEMLCKERALRKVTKREYYDKIIMSML